jgi:hypothetical protein
MGDQMMTREGFRHDHALMMRRIVHDQIDASTPKATADFPKEPSRRLQREPGTEPGDDPPQGPYHGDRAEQRVPLEGRGRVDPSRLAAHQPAQTRQGVRPDVPLVHVDGHALRLPQSLDVCQPLGEGVLGLWLGFGEALPLPLAPEPQLVQVPPRGRAGDGLLERALDIRYNCVPRPGPCPQAHRTGRMRHVVPQLDQFCRTEPGARQPTKRGLQPLSPWALTRWTHASTVPWLRPNRCATTFAGSPSAMNARATKRSRRRGWVAVRPL